MRVAVVGATGLVGSMMLKILEERNFPVSELLPVASEKSMGKKILFRSSEFPVYSPGEALNRKPHLALFSAGGEVSLKLAPQFAETGCVVIDNSSAWRMHPDIKLVVPEINADAIEARDRIIANPNCSTIQMVMALYPLHREFKIRRIVVSTYQSVTGTGKKALDQLMNERAGTAASRIYPYPIDMNVLPQVDIFLENGYTKEEMKMVNETRKILRDDTIQVTSTTVRVPVAGGHSESVNVEFRKDFTMDAVRKILSTAPGVIVQDDPSALLYPMPLTAQHSDSVFVGRLRIDESQPRSLNLWIVSDNLRKGAATNAVQIAEYMIQRNFLG